MHAGRQGVSSKRLGSTSLRVILENPCQLLYIGFCRSFSIIDGLHRTRRMAQPSFSRRRFLKETLLGVAVLSAARLLPSSLLIAQKQAAGGNPLRYFTGQEFQIAKAVADRLIGPPASGGPKASDVDVAGRADRFLSSADPEIQDQFHLLLAVFNSALAAFLFDFRFSSFLNMNPDQQDSYLDDWMTSRLAFRRTAFQGLKRLSMSMFYTDSHTWSEFGYQAVTVPEHTR